MGPQRETQFASVFVGQTLLPMDMRHGKASVGPMANQMDFSPPSRISFAPTTEWLHPAYKAAVWSVMFPLQPNMHSPVDHYLKLLQKIFRMSKTEHEQIVTEISAKCNYRVSTVPVR